MICIESYLSVIQLTRKKTLQILDHFGLRVIVAYEQGQTDVRSTFIYHISTASPTKVGHKKPKDTT